MKYFLSTCFLICIWITSQAQYASLRNYAALDYNPKPQTLSPVFKSPVPAPKFSGKGQKILGMSLTFGGLAIMTVGILEIVAANNADPSSFTPDEVDLVRTEGVILTVVGVAATATGVIFWSKGAKNSGHRGSMLRSPSYQQQLSLIPKGTGAGLRFKF